MQVRFQRKEVETLKGRVRVWPGRMSALHWAFRYGSPFAGHTYRLGVGDEVKYVILQCLLYLGRPLFVPEAHLVDSPEKVLPLGAAHRLLTQQLQHRRAHGGPFFLKGHCSFVLRGKKVNSIFISMDKNERRMV